MELYELHQSLKQIQDEFDGTNTFSKEVMARITKLAKEMKPEAVRIFGEENEVTAELESAILISSNYGQKIKDLEEELYMEALSHFRYGIALFVERIKI